MILLEKLQYRHTFKGKEYAKSEIQTGIYSCPSLNIIGTFSQDHAKTGFDDLYLYFCSLVVEHSWLNEAYVDVEVCEVHLEDIKKVADMVYDHF